MTRRRRGFVEGIELARRSQVDGTGRGRYPSATPWRPRAVGGQQGKSSGATTTVQVDTLTLTASSQQIASGGDYVEWDTELVGLTPREGFSNYGTLPSATVTIRKDGRLLPRLHLSRTVTDSWTVRYHVTRAGAVLTDTVVGPTDGGRYLDDSPGLTVRAGDVLRIQIEQTTGSAQTLDEGRLDLTLIRTVTVTARDPQPGVPANLTATVGSFGGSGTDNDVRLDWDDVTALDVDHYEVWRIDADSGDPDTQIATPSDSTYDDVDLDLGDYRYRVRAVDANGNRSGWSEIVGATVTYDPLDSSVTWAQVFWAEDPDWTNPGDGNPVSSWRDGTGNGNDITASGTERPTYHAAWAALNGKPAIKADGTDDTMREPETPAELQTQPFDWVFVLSDAFVSDVQASLRDWHSDATGRAACLVLPDQPGFGHNTQWQAFAGEELETSADTADDDPHLLIVRFDGASSSIELDGTTLASGDIGTSNTHSAKLWARRTPSTGFSPAAIAFHGVSDGLLTAQEKADLLAWSRHHYGTP